MTVIVEPAETPFLRSAVVSRPRRNARPKVSKSEAREKGTGTTLRFEPIPISASAN